MMLHLVQWAHALEPVRLPLLKLRANHSPNPGLRKSLIFCGTSVWKTKKSEKSKMSNRLTFEFAVKVRKSTIRELQASRRELLVQLAHKTYEPAREKALPGPEVSLWEVSLDRCRQTRQGPGTSLGAFRVGNPLEKIAPSRTMTPK